MKQIKNMLLAVIAITFLSTSAFAGNFGLGASGSIAIVEGSGTEKALTSDTGVENSVTKANASNQAFVGSIFLEYTMESMGGMTFGIDWMPGSAEVNKDKVSRTDVTANGTETTQDDGTSTAQAEVSNHMTYYAELPIHAGTFAKFGFVQVDVDTTETNGATGKGTYGNGTVDGYLFGAGYKADIGGNGYYKLEGTMTSFDSLTLASSTDNSITADLDVTKLTLAYGYKF
jgi:hypothetical protein